MSWNSFPLPEVNDTTRQNLINAGQAILDTRALHPERSLATQYDPRAMTKELVQAHDKLDRVMDKLFGIKSGTTSETQRQKALFSHYAQLTKQLFNY